MFCMIERDCSVEDRNTPERRWKPLTTRLVDKLAATVETHISSSIAVLVA